MSPSNTSSFHSNAKRQLNPNAAGIDVGASELWVAVPEDRNSPSVRTFGTMTSDLGQLIRWLKDCKITTVAMESTGVYWIPLFNLLEKNRIEVKLVNAQHVKHVPGRKSDLKDCQWLQELHSFGLLSGSFHPDANIRELRTYLRQRNNLIQAKSQQINRIHKALTLMNLHLGQVVTDVTGKTGMTIIRAILAGEREASRLAQLRHPGVKSSEEEIVKALEGNYQKDHLFCLQQAVRAYDFYTELLAQCDQEIEALLRQFEEKGKKEDLPPASKPGSRGNAPKFNTRELLFQASGVDLTRIEGINSVTALVIVSEVGLDMSRFPTVKQFTSYLGLCPNHQISGGKILKRSARKVVHRAAQALRMAAYPLQRSASYMGAYYRKMRARKGPGIAITATARKLAEQIYYLLKYGKTYEQKSAEEFEQQNQRQQTKRLEKMAHHLGFQLIPR